MNRFDIGIYGKKNDLVLLVEVKNKSNKSIEWVNDFKRNMFSHSNQPHAKYIMFVLLDKTYLWNNPESHNPNFVLDTHKILGDYAPKNINYENNFEFKVNLWLKNLIKTKKSSLNDEKFDWIFESGLYDQIVDGTVKYENIF
jgi:hypothetical protein